MRKLTEYKVSELDEYGDAVNVYHVSLKEARQIVSKKLPLAHIERITRWWCNEDLIREEFEDITVSIRRRP